MEQAKVKIVAVDLDAEEASALDPAPRFPFSQREKARAAAKAAHERYEQECAEWRARGSVFVPEYWGFVVNAALEALGPDAPR